MRVQFRPAIAADLQHFTARPLPHRIQAIVAIRGDEVLAIGGLGYRPDGTVFAFADFKPEIRRYKGAIHRAGIAGMALIHASGLPTVFAEAQPGNPAAERWLVHFGFTRIEIAGVAAFVWRRDAHDR